MKFGKSILSPSYSRGPNYDSLNSINENFEFICMNCQSKIQVEYNEIIGNEWNWEDNFDKKTNDEIKRFFDINAVNKSPDNGRTAISRFKCSDCQAQYLVYAGVNEYYNSLYKVTLQGIAEIIEN
jgi:transposase-like protein